MQFVVILLPISSSSKDAMSRISFLISSSRASRISSRFSLPMVCRISTASSVSISETISPAFLGLISFRHSPAFSSSRWANASASISAGQMRNTFFRSCSLSCSITSAMSLP